MTFCTKENYNHWYLQECDSELEVVSHHKEVLKKLESLQEELVKLLRGLRDLSWEVVHLRCGCPFDETNSSSSSSQSLSSFISEPSSSVEINQDGFCTTLVQVPTIHPINGALWVILELDV